MLRHNMNTFMNTHHCTVQNVHIILDLSFVTVSTLFLVYFGIFVVFAFFKYVQIVYKQLSLFF